MAIGGKSATTPVTKSASDIVIATLNIDDFEMGGSLPSNYVGRIFQARYVPWDYDGKASQHVLAVRLTIEPDPGQLDASGKEITTQVQYYSAGDINKWSPVTAAMKFVNLDQWDGTNIADVEGVFAGWLGEKTDKPHALNNSTNWAHFLECLKALTGTAHTNPDLRSLEGLYGLWERIPQKSRDIPDNKTDKGGKSFPKTILVLTKLMQAGDSKSAAMTTTTAATSPKPNGSAGGAASVSTSTNATSDDLTEQLINFIADVAIPSHGVDGVLKHADLTKSIGPEFPRGDNGKGHLLALKLVKELVAQAKAQGGDSPFELTDRFIFDISDDTYTGV